MDHIENNDKDRCNDDTDDDSIVYTDSNFPWTVIDGCFRSNDDELLRIQLESYNEFISNGLMKTTEGFCPVVITNPDPDSPDGLEIVINLKNIKLLRPVVHESNGSSDIMFPIIARERALTYSANLLVDMYINYTIKTGSNHESTQTVQTVMPNISIGKIPIMVHSDICVLKHYKNIPNIYTKECEYDHGGYFIIKGSEKIVIAQEKPGENMPYIYPAPKTETKYSYCAEIWSVPKDKYVSPKSIKVYVSTAKNVYGFPITVEIPRTKQHIPLFVLFRALGIESDVEICNKIAPVEGTSSHNRAIVAFLKASIYEAVDTTHDSCISIIQQSLLYTGSEKNKQFIMDYLITDLFPHCSTLEQKIYFLGYMVNKLIMVQLKYSSQSCRDSLANKRIDTTGALINNLYRNYLNRMLKDMTKQIIREVKTGSWKSTDNYANIVNHTNLQKIIKPSTIESGLRRALATGDFSVNNMATKVGVAQVYSRLNHFSSLSHARRMATPNSEKNGGKMIDPRKIDGQTYGYICPYETPEGQTVGVIKNLAILAVVTIPSNGKMIYRTVDPFLRTNDANDSWVTENTHCTKVFVNGCWLGNTDRSMQLYMELKSKKYKGIINIYTSIVFDYKLNEIRICNDAGRLVRPLFKVKNNKLLITRDIYNRIQSKDLSWNDLFLSYKIEESVLEYVDVYEHNNARISTTFAELLNAPSSMRYTHCEIHSSSQFGLMASCIPFLEHNQSPRNTYQCAQGKQAVGVYASNYEHRFDKTAYILNYPMKPLVETRFMNITRVNNLSSGTQSIVAIMTYTGYNQEDSLLINRGSIERGFATITVYKTERDEDKQKINGDEEIRGIPDKTKTKGMKMGNYSKLHESGVVPKNTVIVNHDVIISKSIPIKGTKRTPLNAIKYEDHSRVFRLMNNDDKHVVDKTCIDRNGDGYQFASVTIRNLRMPVIGDKFSSRHGQKGTVGLIIDEQDMPFTASGIRPDIIINPHAIPSRMTIGQLKETLMGKTLVEIGILGDGSPFSDEWSVESLRDELLKQGFEQNGNELMYNGQTGEQHECSVFMGPVFYQRLKHMVNDKAHSRSIGPMVNLTRQPSEGRCRDGGLRFGEMERDCMISHGASRFTRERLYDASDKYDVHTCKRCGSIAAYNDADKIHKCFMCENQTDFSRVEIPYAYKLLSQELMTMGINPRLVT